MAENVTYYVIIDDEATRLEPAGILRRRASDRGIYDEGLSIGMRWEPSSLIVEWERAESGEDLVKVSADEADQVVGRLRERWGVR
jgi:hypothetical protein